MCLGLSLKPEIILHYNRTKAGVDVADQMVGTYSCQRFSFRWPMKIFYAILDIAALNSWLLWKYNNTAPAQKRKKALGRRIFLRELCYELVMAHVKRRSQCPQLKKFTKDCMLTLGIEFPKPPAPPAATKRGDCLFCRAAGKRSQPKQRCAVCQYFVCEDHKSAVCQGCVVIVNPGPPEVAEGEEAEGAVPPQDVEPAADPDEIDPPN